MSLPATKSEARDAGEPHYFTGIPCARGHISKRYASTGQCFDCQYENRIRWRTENPEKEREIRVKSLRKWASENPERKKEKARKFNAKHSAANVARARKWKRDNPERARELATNADRNRHAREVNAEGSHSVDDVLAILNSQDWECTYCSADLTDDRHIDHIVPLSRGGSNWPNNLQGLCPPCNLRKANKTHDEFVTWLAEIAANDNKPESDLRAA